MSPSLMGLSFLLYFTVGFLSAFTAVRPCVGKAEVFIVTYYAWPVVGPVLYLASLAEEGRNQVRSANGGGHV